MDRFDTFYYSTICHVCKNADSGSGQGLKRCGGCGMISYCSVQHQKIHWPKHKKLCKCIQSVNSYNNLQHLFQGIKCSDDWFKVRCNAMLLVELAMDRSLSTAERQMFICPRICEVCREIDSKMMRECQGCHCLYYCSALHQQQDFTRHAASCPSLKFCFDIDKYMFETGDPYPVLVAPVRIDYEPLPKNIDSFISDLVGVTDTCSKFNQNIKNAVISETLTCPLTLLYAIECVKEKMNEEMVIHVVGAGSLECTFLNTWEIILHYLPQLIHLNIIFVGPEIQPEFDEKSTVCADCQDKKRTLNTNFKCELYHQYAVSEEFVKPDIIVAYNCGIHEFEGSDNDTWLQSLPYLVKFEHTSLVLTSYTKEESEKDIGRIMDCRDHGIVTHLHCVNNPFASKRPYIDAGSAHTKVFFQNNFISVLTVKTNCDKRS